ncbi:MAG TPA: M56 family metallopeptidase [Pirellulales bacterium]|jgi:beta-lactamase regulating signal transducer with metallopeptidase domain/Leucine-rich repeat (LRR) protein
MISAWNDFANVWATALWRASSQGAIAVAIAWAITRWFKLSPRVVCWMWRLVCLKLLVTFVWGQPIELELLPARVQQTSIRAPMPQTKVDWSLEPSFEKRDFAPPPLRHEPVRIAITFWAFLLPIWLLGKAFCIYRSIRQWSTAGRLLNAGKVKTTSCLLQLCVEEGGRLGVHRVPAVHQSPDVRSPVLVGIWRPAIIVPENTEQTFDEPEQRMMLAHELAHLKRHDLAWNWLPTVVTWLFYFNPLVWLMVRRWSEAQEAACDEMLIQNGVAQPADYGRLLAKVSALSCLGSRPGLAVAGVVGAYRNLERRILTMARLKPFSARRMAVAALLLSTTGITTVVPWRLVAQETKTTQELVSVAKKKGGINFAPAEDISKVRRVSGEHAITLTGHATDAHNNPVAGARVYLMPLGVDREKSIANTTTDSEGAFEFRDAKLPLDSREHPRGAFQIYGTAPKLGLAWQGDRYFYPVNRAQGNPDERRAVYADDNLVADLKFDNEAVLNGRVLDEAGNAIPSAEIVLQQCHKLGSEVKPARDDRYLIALDDAPITISDAEGHFVLPGLTKETAAFIRVTHPDFGDYGFEVGLTDDPGLEREDNGRKLIVGEANLRLTHARNVQLKVEYGDTGVPVTGVSIWGVHRDRENIFITGRTDEAGVLNRAVLPGEYTLDIRPGSATLRAGYIAMRLPLVVNDKPQEQTIVIQLPAACTLDIEVVDADSGRGIPNVIVADAAEFEGGAKWTGHVIYGETNTAGKLRKLVPAGKHMYGPLPPRGYEVVDSSNVPTDLPSGGIVPLRFKLRKQADDAEAEAEPIPNQPHTDQSKGDTPDKELVSGAGTEKEVPATVTGTFTADPAHEEAQTAKSDPAAQRSLKRLKELGATPATLKQIGIQGGWKGTDADLRLVNDLPDLEWLYLDLEEHVGIESLGKLELKRPLNNLALSHLSDGVLERAPELSECDRLTLLDYEISDEGWRRFAQLVDGVKILELNGAAGPVGISDKGLKEISLIRSLTGLQIFNGDITDDGLRHLTGLDKLANLNLSNCAKVRGSGYAHLAAVKSLRHLSAFPIRIDNDNLQVLAKLTQLESISLQVEFPATELGPKDIGPLKDLSNLRSMTITNVGPRVKEDLGNAVLAAVGQMQSLSSLRIYGLGMSVDGVDALVKAPSLQELYLDSVELHEQTLTALKRLKDLRKLGLGSVGVVGDAALQKLVAFEQLTQVSLTGSGLSDDGLAKFANLHALEILNLPDSKITGTGLAGLANLKQLRTLTLSDSPFNDEGFQLLRRLPTLEWLYLGKTMITDQGLNAIGMLPNLRMLNLDDANITVDGLIKLSDLKRLSYISAVGMKVSDAEMARLRAALPKTQISVAAPPAGINGFVYVADWAITEEDGSEPAGELKADSSKEASPQDHGNRTDNNKAYRARPELLTPHSDRTEDETNKFSSSLKPATATIQIKANDSNVTRQPFASTSDLSDGHTVQYTETRTIRIPSGPKVQGLIRRVKVMGRYRMREEMTHTPGDEPESGDSSSYVQITDAKKGIHLSLSPDAKSYEYVRQIFGINDKGEVVESKPEPQPQVDYYGRMRNVPIETATKLNDRFIDGKVANGFEVIKKVERAKGTDTWTRKYWLDPKTKLPVQVEISLRTTDPHRAESDWVQSAIVFDEPLNPEIFSTEPPDGFKREREH